MWSWSRTQLQCASSVKYIYFLKDYNCSTICRSEKNIQHIIIKCITNIKHSIDPSSLVQLKTEELSTLRNMHKWTTLCRNMSSTSLKLHSDGWVSLWIEHLVFFLVAESWSVQLWIQSCARHRHFLHNHPTTEEYGQDKYHRDQPSHPTRTEQWLQVTVLKSLGLSSLHTSAFPSSGARTWIICWQIILQISCNI